MQAQTRLKESTLRKESTPRRVRGRPRAFDNEAILDAALELFWKKGYRSTTTRDLEAALGLSQSSISNAFGAKQDLLEAALDRYEEKITAMLLGPLEESDEGLTAIEDFFSALGYWVTHDGNRGCMLINMMAEDGDTTDAITQRSRRYRQRIRTALHKSLEHAAKRGETAKKALDARTDLLVGLVLGVNIAARGGAQKAEIDSFFKAARNQVGDWRLAHAHA